MNKKFLNIVDKVTPLRTEAWKFFLPKNTLTYFEVKGYLEVFSSTLTFHCSLINFLGSNTLVYWEEQKVLSIFNINNQTLHKPKKFPEPNTLPYWEEKSLNIFD